MRGIAVFDLDGTLARTIELDDASWLGADLDALGLESMETDKGHYLAPRTRPSRWNLPGSVPISR